MESKAFMLGIRIVAVTFGVLGGGFIGNLIGPWVAKSRRGQSGVLITCALLGGVVMWLALAHSGGSGFGFGSHGKDKDKGTSDTAHKDSRDKGETDKDHSKKTETTLTVTVLGGERVLEQRFYVLGTDAPRNRLEIEKAILDKTKADPSLKALEILLYNDSVPKDSEAVTELVEWAKRNELTPKVTLVDKRAP
jgi:hypothetical protein